MLNICSVFKKCFLYVYIRLIINSYYYFPILSLSAVMLPLYYGGSAIRTVIIAYIIYISFFDTTYKTGLRLAWFPNFYSPMTSFFPIKLVATAPINQSKNHLVGIHPHGLGVLSNLAFHTENFKKIFGTNAVYHLAIAKFFFISPVLREWMQMASCGIVADKDAMMSQLSKPGGSRVVALVIGGAREAFYSDKDDYRIILKNRKGFCRLALESGADLLPAYGFGELGVIEYLPGVFQPGHFLNKFAKFGFDIFGLPFLLTNLKVHKKPITLVLGQPLSVEKVTDPTQQQVDQLHARYVTEIMRIFNQHKGQYLDDPNAELIIK